MYVKLHAEPCRFITNEFKKDHQNKNINFLAGIEWIKNTLISKFYLREFSNHFVADVQLIEGRHVILAALQNIKEDFHQFRDGGKSENMEGRVVMWGQNLPPVVVIGLSELSKYWGACDPLPPRFHHPCHGVSTYHSFISFKAMYIAFVQGFWPCHIFCCNRPLPSIYLDQFA